MSAGLINIAALVVVGVAGSVAGCARESSGVRYVAALCVALAAGVVLTVSSVVMAIDWPAQMEQFDFTAFRRPRRDGGLVPTAGVYFLPYYNACVGVFATYFCGRLIYRRVRGYEG